jgi:plastocyanin
MQGRGTWRAHGTLAVRVALAASVALTVGACSTPAPVDPNFAGAQATVTAVNITFKPAEVTLPSGTPLRIVLDNRDSGVPHDIRVFQGDHEIARSPVVTGPALTEVRFGPLAPGRYQFQCTIHPSMIGTLIITGAAGSGG